MCWRADTMGEQGATKVVETFGPIAPLWPHRAPPSPPPPASGSPSAPDGKPNAVGRQNNCSSTVKLPEVDILHNKRWQLLCANSSTGNRRPLALIFGAGFSKRPVSSGKVKNSARSLELVERETAQSL